MVQTEHVSIIHSTLIFFFILLAQSSIQQQQQQHTHTSMYCNIASFFKKYKSAEYPSYSYVLLWSDSEWVTKYMVPEAMLTHLHVDGVEILAIDVIVLMSIRWCLDFYMGAVNAPQNIGEALHGVESPLLPVGFCRRGRQLYPLSGSSPQRIRDSINCPACCGLADSNNVSNHRLKCPCGVESQSKADLLHWCESTVSWCLEFEISTKLIDQFKHKIPSETEFSIHFVIVKHFERLRSITENPLSPQGTSISDSIKNKRRHVEAVGRNYSV